MISLGEAFVESLFSLIRDLWEQLEAIPEGPQRDRIDEKIRRLEDAIGALE